MEQNFVKNFKLNKLLNDRLRDIRKKNTQIKPSAKGSYSFCYPFNNFVILKNISKYETGYNAEVLEESFERKKQKFNWLKNKFNVNIAEYHCCYAGKHHFYIIQERLEGEILSVHYPSTARSISRGKNEFGEYTVQDNNDRRELSATHRVSEFDDIDILDYEYPEISKAVSRKNNAMLKQLKEANQAVFDKFVRDFKVLLENGVSVDTTLSENFLFDKKKGFSFVDLDLAPEGYKVPSDAEIALKCFDAFQDFSRYKSPEDAKVLTSNFMAVKQKLLQAILNNGFKLSLLEVAYLKAACGLSDDIKKGK